jgi:hypothetical protein
MALQFSLMRLPQIESVVAVVRRYATLTKFRNTASPAR